MKLIPLYESILRTAHLTCSADGYVSRKLLGDPEPALIKGKRLVLPTPDHLAKTDNEVRFHPLSENILRGESEVLEFFRSALNIRMNYTLSLLVYQMMVIGTSPAVHKKLSPDQSLFLSKVKNADEKTLEVLQRLMKAMPYNQTQKAFVSIYLKKGGVVGDRKYMRAGIVTFPLYNELVKGELEVYGVKMRVKDRDSIRALLEYMFPNIDKVGSYSRGSDSQVAPFLDALMKSVMSLASPLNDLVELYKKHIDDPENMMFESGWVETFDNLEVMLPEIRKVPMQSGNEGSTTATAAAPAAESVAFAGTKQQEQPAATQPWKPTPAAAPATATQDRPRPYMVNNQANGWQQNNRPAYGGNQGGFQPNNYGNNNGGYGNRGGYGGGGGGFGRF